MIRNGYSKSLAVYAAFLFSAVGHELVISVPFRVLSFHAFFGMLAQVLYLESYQILFIDILI